MFGHVFNSNVAPEEVAMEMMGQKEEEEVRIVGIWKDKKFVINIRCNLFYERRLLHEQGKQELELLLRKLYLEMFRNDYG